MFCLVFSRWQGWLDSLALSLLSHILPPAPTTFPSSSVRGQPIYFAILVLLIFATLLIDIKWVIFKIYIIYFSEPGFQESLKVKSNKINKFINPLSLLHTFIPSCMASEHDVRLLTQHNCLYHISDKRQPGCWHWILLPQAMEWKVSTQKTSVSHYCLDPWYKS